MGTATMGKVLVPATVENIYDLYNLKQGQCAPSAVRRLEVAEALVDTGATGLLMPKSLVAQLGLMPLRTRKGRTAAGPTILNVFGAVRLTIQGRDCTCDVTEIPDDCPVLIGQVPLELLDFVVDPVGQRLIGNPAHGGEQMFEVYSFFPPAQQTP
jgi:clan AA aspartic protease